MADKSADKFTGIPKGRGYCDTPGNACWYNSTDRCVNCGRVKGWKKVASDLAHVHVDHIARIGWGDNMLVVDQCGICGGFQPRDIRVMDVGDLEACDDCIQLIANDEADDEHRAKFKAWQDEYGDDAMLVLGSGEGHFGHSRCAGCGTTLAGNRHEVFALV